MLEWGFSMHPIDLKEVSETHPVRIMADLYETLPRTVCPKSPLWAVFDPIDVPTVLEWTAVVSREDDSLEGHRYTLMGEGVKMLMGRNYTGRSVAEVFSEKRLIQQWTNFALVTDTRRPSFSVLDVPIEGRDFISVYQGCFPFCDEAKFINRLVLVVAQVADLSAGPKASG